MMYYIVCILIRMHIYIIIIIIIIIIITTTIIIIIIIVIIIIYILLILYTYIHIIICICCIMYPNQYPHVQLRSAPALSLSNAGNPMPKAYNLGMVHTSFTTLLHVLMVGSHLDPTFLLCFNHVKLLNHSNIF